MVSGSLDDSKSTNSSSFSLLMDEEEKPEPSSSNPSGFKRFSRASSTAGSIVLKSDSVTNNKASDAKTPDSVVSNGRMDDVTSNGRIDGSVVIRSTSDSGRVNSYHGPVTRAASKPSDDIYLTDNCIKDYYQETTEPCVYAATVSDSESTEVQSSISRDSSSSAAFPGTDRQGSPGKRSSGTQDSEDYADVFQREVVCGSISPETALCAEDELILQLDDQNAGINQISGSDDLDSNAVTEGEPDSSDGIPKTEGVEEADVMCGAHLLDSVEKDDEGLVSIVTGKYFEVTDSLVVYVTVSSFCLLC